MPIVVKKLSRVCKHCEKTFFVTKKQILHQAKKYCSQECYFLELKANAVKSLVSLICTYCNREFKLEKHAVSQAERTTKVGKRVFCNRQCANASRRKDKKPYDKNADRVLVYKKKIISMRPCLLCKKPFMTDIYTRLHPACRSQVIEGYKV